MFKKEELINVVGKLKRSDLKFILENDLCFNIDVLDEDMSSKDYDDLYEDFKNVLIGDLSIEVFFGNWWGEDLEDFTFTQLYNALERILN